MENEDRRGRQDLRPHDIGAQTRRPGPLW
jgi:hypothetical protein